MRIHWNGFGRIINGDYVFEWNRFEGCMHYFIHSLRTGKCILEIIVR